MSLKEQLVKAARMHAEGELERAKTNIMVYMNNACLLYTSPSPRD